MGEGGCDAAGLLRRLDLCVLAYHSYNQTLIWPLDPWYERWSRPGSSRRDNMLAAVHCAAVGLEALRGPGSVRAGWGHDAALDPVLADYRQMRPWCPSVTHDGEAYKLFTGDPDTLRSIDEVVVVEHAAEPVAGAARAAPRVAVRIPNPAAAPDARSRIHAFEGGTGAIEGRPGAWGVLGIVVDCERDDGGHDVEIVFRGSQSGNAYRAAYLGFVREGGNPDWVTDMELVKRVADPTFSPVGSVVTGFRDSVVSAMPTLARCLELVEETRGGPPTTIHVSGHSLGGALATQFAAGATVGRLPERHLPGVAHWPWSTTTLTSFGAPKVGDDAFAAHVDQHLTADRVWVAGDPITRFPTNAHVGRPVELASDATGTETHEPSVIRASLVREMGAARSVVPTDPWRSIGTLGDVLRTAADEGVELDALFATSFVEWCDLSARLAGDVVADRSSYRVPWTKTRRELQGRRRRLLGVFDGPTRSLDELESRVGALVGVQPDSDVELHLQHVLIIREAKTHGWSTATLLSRPVLAAALDGRTAAASQRARALAAGSTVSQRDRTAIERIIALRLRHHEVVDGGRVRGFRRRHVPTSGMPALRRSCEHHPGLPWLPTDLVVPDRVPPEGTLPKAYVAAYYGTSKLCWNLYHRRPIDPTVEWDPAAPWNHAFPPTADGWEDPTSDDTYVRLRLQGPNPFALRRSATTPLDDVGRPVYEVDHSADLAGVLPPTVARFADDHDRGLVPLDITIGGHEHRPGDPAWDDAKRVVNAADARLAVLGRHLLDVHFIVGQSFALAAFRLPSWHRLRPFMQFFTYGTLTVNDMAYRALLAPSSYFIGSGFFSVTDARHLFRNRTASFDLDDWIVPRDLERRGLDGLRGRHPYADDASLVWPAFVEVVSGHLDDLRLDDEAIAADADLQGWYSTLTDILPGTSPASTGDTSLDRARLEELCTALLWNNVVHEVCGDFSPILGSEDPADKTVVDLAALRRRIDGGTLTGPATPPGMASCFLIDQASWVSRFNVGGNNMMEINAARWVDDPKLRIGIERFQSTLRDLDDEIDHRNRGRAVRYGRMLPRNWEASISF